MFIILMLLFTLDGETFEGSGYYIIFSQCLAQYLIHAMMTKFSNKTSAFAHDHDIITWGIQTFVLCFRKCNPHINSKR